MLFGTVHHHAVLCFYSSPLDKPNNGSSGPFVLLVATIGGCGDEGCSVGCNLLDANESYMKSFN